MEPFNCRVANKNRNTVPFELRAILFREVFGKGFSCKPIRILNSDEQSISLQLSIPETKTKINLKFEFQAMKMKLHFIAEQEEIVDWVGIDLNATPQEHFIGLGEGFDCLDQAGKRVDLLLVNSSSGGKTFKPLPFYMSTADYGVHINTHAQTITDFATILEPNETNIRIADHNAELNFTFNSSFKQNLTEYVVSATYPDPPQLWIFDPWKSHDWTQENEETAFEDIELVRKHHLAGKVNGIDDDWETQLNDFMFDPEHFPHAQVFVDHCYVPGFTLVIWIAPWTVYSDEPTPVFKFCVENRFLITKTSGETYVNNLDKSLIFLGSCFDFSNPDAVEWWRQQIKRLVKIWIGGFKTDFGEQVPLDVRYFGERTGVDHHNLFSVMQDRATYQAMTEIKPGMLFARSAWQGSQAYSVIWAGDQTSDFSPANGFLSVITADQTAGVSGFPFWTSDIGGFLRVPTEKVFLRWIQFGAFSPLMLTHGLGNREPWNYSDQTLRINRRYAQFQLNLFPYIYAAAQSAWQDGIPIMRALALDFQDDPNIWTSRAEHQYKFGDQLLVALIFSGDDKLNIIHLPNDLWLYFSTDEKYSGGTEISFPGSLESIPVFSKVGAITPLLDPSPDTTLETQDANLISAGPDLRLQIINFPLVRQISIKLLPSRFNILNLLNEQNHPITVQTASLSGDSSFNRVSVRKNDMINIFLDNDKKRYEPQINCFI